MQNLKTWFGAAALAATASFSTAPAAVAADCGSAGEVKIAEMTWLSAGTLAHVVQTILSSGYGCDAKTVPGDTVPTATSMLSKNDPQIAPEMWVSTAAAIWDKILAKGNVYKAGDIFTDGGQEGWWIPDYVAKANPELKSVTDLEKYPELFQDASNPGKGRLYGCPPGWGCEIITNNLFKALNLGDKNWELFSPGSGANLKASIARLVTRKQPVAAYYWGPTAVIGRYNLVRLDMPAHDAAKFKCLTDKNCANPEVTGWAKGEVAVAVVKELQEKAPDVAEFLGKLQVSNADMNAVLAWADENKANPEDAAKYFLKNYESAWTQWVPADVAKKVKAAL
ncbi:MAG: ABC transporter substrate-binding protein [Pseudomonadota bacterium]